MEKFEIHIGEVLDCTDPKNTVPKPAQILIVNFDQLMVLEQFAHTRKDENLNTVYRLNECEFKVLPRFEKD